MNMRDRVNLRRLKSMSINIVLGLAGKGNAVQKLEEFCKQLQEMSSTMKGLYDEAPDYDENSLNYTKQNGYSSLLKDISQDGDKFLLKLVKMISDLQDTHFEDLEDSKLAPGNLDDEVIRCFQGGYNAMANAHNTKLDEKAQKSKWCCSLFRSKRIKSLKIEDVRKLEQRCKLLNTRMTVAEAYDSVGMRKRFLYNSHLH